MSEEKKEVQVECSLCGHAGGPYDACGLCHGNKHYTQERHYTLTEERKGEGKSDPDRYGRTGAVRPKLVRLPGSFVPDEGH